MNKITKNGFNYINGEFILKNAPIYSKTCRGTRDLIKKRNISNNDYLFMRLKDSDWIISNGSSPKFDKVFFKESFINNIPELNNNEDNKITDDKGIEKAPDIIELDDSQKFKDNEDNIIEIETRGIREHDKIYFRVKDVSKAFNILNLQDTIIDKYTKYKENIHYKYFITIDSQDMGIKTSKNKDTKINIKKEIFLTYQGILRVLFVSENDKTINFINWATKTLFVAQIGTPEQKKKLVSKLLGVDAKVIKEVFNSDRNTLPCVYLFTLNKVDKLRSSMKIDNKYSDDSIVCKYGFTKDLSRRTSEHISNFSKIENVDLKLKYYSYVDPQYMSNAENDIKVFMEALNINFKYENNDEIVIIPKHLIDLVDKQYTQIGKLYMGHIAELITKIKEKDTQLLMKEKDIELLMKDMELQKVNHENEILHFCTFKTPML